MPALDLLAWVLVVVWGVLLFGGFVFGPQGRAERRMPAWTRLASSGVLVVLAIYGFILASGQGLSSYGGGIALGMALGFLGDLFMAGALPAPNRVIAGMASFGIGHVAYIGAMIWLAPPVWWAVGLWLLIDVLLFYVLLLRGRRASALLRAALIYSLLLASTAGFGLGLAIGHPLFAGLAVGAALFLVSDLLIALDLFAGVRLPLHDDLVWLLYGPGQLLIVLSTWSAMQV